MSPLIFIHILSGLTGIAAGLVAVVGIYLNKTFPFFNAIFLSMTAVACGTGFVFLPTDGVTSAQLVSFFVTSLLLVAAYARYAKHLAGSWNPVYAFAAVGALFLNILITTAQSFLHIPALRALAPSQQSPLYVAVKVILLLVFIAVALLVAKRAATSQKSDS
jgi:hypothetical protein